MSKFRLLDAWAQFLSLKTSWVVLVQISWYSKPVLGLPHVKWEQQSRDACRGTRSIQSCLAPAQGSHIFTGLCGNRPRITLAVVWAGQTHLPWFLSFITIIEPCAFGDPLSNGQNEYTFPKLFWQRNVSIPSHRPERYFYNFSVCPMEAIISYTYSSFYSCFKVRIDI